MSYCVYGNNYTKVPTTLERLYEYEKDFFSYFELAKEKWQELIREAQDTFNVHFDLENDSSTKQQRTIKIPQKEWDFTECKFKCELFSAGGDWQVPAYYFRCQLEDGYAFGVKKYRNSGLFVYIPSKTEGNYHLVRTDKDWYTPDNNNYKEGIDPERSDKDCWKSLEKYLEKLVKLEIEKVRKEK